MIKIKNLTNKGEIYIYGNIVSDTEASWLQMDGCGTLGYQYPTQIKEQLDDLKGKPIDVHIASDGGDVAAGVAIYNMLANHDADVTVYIDSWAASIASLIAFAGKRIVMPENTFLMIHRPVAGAYGNSDYIKSVAEWLNKIENMLAETYARHIPDDSGLSFVHEAMDKETWLTAKEAKDLFPDVVELTAANEIEAVAEFKSGSAKAPEAVNAAAYKKKQEAAASAMRADILKTLNATLEVKE